MAETENQTTPTISIISVFFPPGIPVFSLSQHEGRTLTGQGHTAVLPTATGEDHALPLPSSQTSTLPRSNDDQGG